MGLKWMNIILRQAGRQASGLYLSLSQSNKGYTWSSLTMEQPPFSSGLKVSSEHFLSRNKPTRIFKLH